MATPDELQASYWTRTNRFRRKVKIYFKCLPFFQSIFFFWNCKSLSVNIQCRKKTLPNSEALPKYTLTSGQSSFSRLLNSNWTIQIIGARAVCKENAHNFNNNYLKYMISLRLPDMKHCYKKYTVISVSPDHDPSMMSFHNLESIYRHFD